MLQIDDILERVNAMIDENEEVIRESQRIIDSLSTDPESRPECRPYQGEEV